jgi:hypothetical protein
MKSIDGRPAKLEAKFAPVLQRLKTERAGEELLEKLRALRERLPPEDRVPESGSALEAALRGAD